jgi:hypothetical protein
MIAIAFTSSQINIYPNAQLRKVPSRKRPRTCRSLHCQRAARSQGRSACMMGRARRGILTVLAKGPGAAVESGTLVLKGRSRNIWETALRSAPSHAIELTLQNIRLPDEIEPGASVVWCPAAHLSAATRPWVRLLGLTAGAWPRCMTEDPILPQHIISTRAFGIDPVPEADRRAFAVIVASAHAGIVFSRSRRTSLGPRVGPSPLLPQERSEQTLSRARMRTGPSHGTANGSGGSEPRRIGIALLGELAPDHAD